MTGAAVRVVIVCGVGINCETETALCFEQTAKLSGLKAEVSVLHLNHIIKDPKVLDGCSIFVIPGGFSYGDYTGAGNILSLHLKREVLKSLTTLVDNGGLVLGICNGCQALLKLIPDFLGISTATNDIGTYQCRWTKLMLNASNNSPWLQKVSRNLDIPVAHQEGKFVMSEEKLSYVKSNNMIALQYADNTGKQANGKFPFNPSGSMYDIAGITDKSGRILAIMPHPERAMFFRQNHLWTLTKKSELKTYGDGFLVLAGAIEHCAQLKSQNHNYKTE